MRTQSVLSTLTLGFAPWLHAQMAIQPQGLQPAQMPMLEIARRADLLPAGKAQGTWQLTGLVRRDRTVVLRWGNDAGEMPTEGVRIYRQKEGSSTWKDITGRHPVGFLQGRSAEKGLDAMKEDEREDLLAYPFGDVAHDPTTQLRLPWDLKLQGSKKPRDFTPAKSLAQFRSLRTAGRLNRQDMELFHTKADANEALAQALGLTFTDDPGRGSYRYKITVGQADGSVVDVVCPKTFNTSEPTPVPQPLNLTAASGNGEVLLNWDETPSDALGGYNIYRAENPGGPWKRLNEDPIKRVELEVEPPEQTLRRALGLRQAMDRMLRPLPPAARTPQKVMEAQRQALEQVERPGGLPELSAAQSQQVQTAVAAGRLRAGGPQAPRALFTDSLQRPESGLQNERTYHYKVTSIDLGGQEQPLDTAPVVAGIPKDLEPPKVPGRPTLQAELAAQADLRALQTARWKDLQLAAPALAPAAKLAPSPLALAPPAAAGAAPAVATLAPQRLRLAKTLSTLPVAALKKLAEASLLRSRPDGTVPPANLVWQPSPEADTQGYRLHRAVGSGPLAPVAETTTASWTDTSLEPGKAYRYAVAAVDHLGNVSGLSPIATVEVCDASLPGRLALQVKGNLAPERPSHGPSRTLIRALPARLRGAGLTAAPVALETLRAKEPVVATFVAPKILAQPTVSPALKARPTGLQPTLVKELELAPVADLDASKFTSTIKPIVKVLPRTLNPMTLVPAAPKELHVALAWSKPVEGLPLSYVVQQASQRMELVSSLRPGVTLAKGFRAFSLDPRNPAKPGFQAPAPSAAALRTPGMIAAPAPALRARILKGFVAAEGQGLRVAEARQGHRAVLAPQGGPGPFTRVNEGPITTERYGITFPAEAAQYGGATYYFRVQAIAQEFGRPVEGAFSEPVEVRLPDVVPPPAPAVGAVDLRVAAASRLDAALSWTQLPAKDLAGVVVDRQPMTFTMVEGEAKPGAPAGPAERLTPSPVKGLAFTDAQAPSGYQRYTLRSVDATGNLSEAVGHLDILVPGEPRPGAPANPAASGAQLTWAAAPLAQGYTVWRSFTGVGDDWECISGILPASATSFSLPAEGALHLKVVARSLSGLHTTPSATVVRTP